MKTISTMLVPKNIIEDLKMLDAKDFLAVHTKATQNAKQKADEFYRMHGDRDVCGFAWVEVKGVRSNSKLGKALQEQGFRKGVNRNLTLWNPAKVGVQSMSVIEAGAEGYAEVLRGVGLDAYMMSRID